MSGAPVRMAGRAVVVLGYLTVYALIWAGLTMLTAGLGIRYFWGEISVTQMRLNLVSVETDGGGGALVWLGILGVGVAPILVTGGIALWQLRRRRAGRRAVGTASAGSAPRERRSPWIMRTVSTALVGTLVIAGSTAFVSTLGIRDYVAAAASEYAIGDYYAAPTVTSAENKRNLVVVYLESGEETLANDEFFEKDAFAALKDVTEESDGWQSIEDFEQYRGGGWTMSGLVSTQCGIPLKGSGPASDSTAPSESGNDVETYLGGVTCLGDVLADHGYTNVFLGGANGSFAAKDTFLATHGYSTTKDLTDWRLAGEAPSSFRSDWGLSDERLLANAKTEVDALHAEAERTGTPFNLSVLTLDTHEPVHVYDYCGVDTSNEVTSVFSCSMDLVADFVQHLERQGYLEDTAVAIMGDHLKHMNAGDAFQEQLADHPNRTIFNRLWVPGTQPELRAGVDQLSMYPTLLEAAGFTLADREAGLGVSAFTSTLPLRSAQSLEPDVYGELLDSHSSEFYEGAWGTVAAD